MNNPGFGHAWRPQRTGALLVDEGAKNSKCLCLFGVPGEVWSTQRSERRSSNYMDDLLNVVDRVAQMAAFLVLEPIFEADFADCSYGFRPGSSAHDAIAAVSDHLKAGYSTVIETRLGLTLNRDKTRIVDLRQSGSALDFLGYTFRYDRDLHGGSHRYLYVGPSAKALARARDHLRELTAARYCFVPLPHLIARINRYLVGWQAYFRVGYPRRSYRHLNHHARRRLACHLRRRSQRPFRPPEGVTLYRHLADLGLVYL